MGEKKIEISRFAFWAICTIGAGLVTAVGVWSWHISQRDTQSQVDMAKVVTTLTEVNRRLDANLSLSQDIISIQTRLSVLELRVQDNANDLNSSSGIRFNMPDYEKYVKPPIDTLLDRVARLEVRVEGQ